MYHLITNKQSLIDENRELKLEIMNMKKVSLSDMERKELTKLMKENMRLEKELKEEKVNSEYYNRLYESEKEDKHNRIRKCYDWIRGQNIRVNYDEFHEWVMSDVE